jgi:hypothetical protein
VTSTETKYTRRQKPENSHPFLRGCSSLVEPTFNAFIVKARVDFITTEGKLKSISVIVEFAGTGVTKYITTDPQ